MNRVKTITLGTISGLVVSLISIMLISSLWGLFTRQPSALATLVIFGLFNGAIVGGAGCLLKQMTQGLEHRLLVVLVSMAMTAISVLFGNHSSQSLLPLAFYAMALVNGLLAGQVTAVLVQVPRAR